MKNFKLKVVLLFTMLLISTNKVMASEILEKLQEEAEEPHIQEYAWNLVKPAVSLVMVVITAIGVIILIGATIYIGLKAVALLRGKGSIGKNEIKTFCIALAIGLLISGGGIFGIIQVGNKIAIEPGTQILQEQQDQSQNQKQDQNKK